MAIAEQESNFSTHVRAPTSSATGLFQFIESTWLRTLRDFGPKHGLTREAQAIQNSDGALYVADSAKRAHILGLRNNPYIAALMAGEMLNHDRQWIAERIGRDLTHGETYLAHFLGPEDAAMFLSRMQRQPQTQAANLLPGPARANHAIFYAGRRRAGALSVAAVHDKFEAMMHVRHNRFAHVEEVVGLSAYASQ
jgi:hypothetical protein